VVRHVVVVVGMHAVFVGVLGLGALALGALCNHAVLLSVRSVGM